LSLLAECSVFKLEGDDSNVRWIEFIEDILRIIRTVLVTDSGVVSTDDEVTDTVILANQSMKNRFTRSGIAHCSRHHREQGSLGDEIVLDNRGVAIHAHIGWNVPGLSFTDQGMNKEAITNFRSALAEILMRSVDRIPCLERCDSVPAARFE
jgi:hypothetical protein